MARGVNKAIIIGNLTRDVEVKYLTSGKTVANISVATNEQWKDRQTGEQQERAEYHNIVLYDRLAEIAGEYLKKGSQVYVEGSIRTRKWQDKEGKDRYTTEIIGRDLQMLGSKPAGEQRQSQNPPSTGGGASSKASTDYEDDIPFAAVPHIW